MYNKLNKIGCCILVALMIWSCGTPQKGEIGDVSFLLHTYNTQMWGDYLNDRKPKDTLVSQQLLNVSRTIGSLAREIGAKSGGLNKDGSLFNPSMKNPMEAKELEEFYKLLSFQLLKIKSVNVHEGLNEEAEKVIHFVFLNKEGMLSKDRLSAMSVVEAVSTLFILENICYYLIVKYC